MTQMEPFSHRRSLFLDQLGTNRVAILVGAQESMRNGNLSYPFRQHSDFFYLTGFSEPNAIAVFTPNREHSFTLFVDARDETRERYTGPKKGVQEAKDEYGASQSFKREEFESQLRHMLHGYREVVMSLGQHPKIEQLVLATISQIASTERRGGRAPSRISDLRTILHEQRLLKDEAAISDLRKAIDITQ